MSLSLGLSANIISISDFSTGMDGWEPNNPWKTNTVGGLSPSNPYLEMIVGDYGNRGSKLITFNPTSPWVGDLYTMGVNSLSLDIRNWSTSDSIYLRVVIGNAANPQQEGGSWWISQTPIIVRTEADWQNITLSITADSMQRVGNLLGELGTDSWEATMGNVQGFRIVSSIIGDAAIGDEFFGTVGFDNITLYAIPEPSGSVGLLALFSLGIWMRRRC